MFRLLFGVLALGSIFAGILSNLSAEHYVAAHVDAPASVASAILAPASSASTTGTTSDSATILKPAPAGTLTIAQPTETPLSTSGLAVNGFVTESQLQNALASIQQEISGVTNPPAPGGVANEIALSNRIDALSNVTISNANISANSIPDLSGSYLSLSGGTVGSTTLSNLNLDTALSIANGGTGTSTAPTANKLLFSDTNGNWEYVATSSLGISSSPWTASGSNVYFTGGNVYIGTTSAQSIGDGTPNFDLLQQSGVSLLNVQANSSYADLQGVSYRNSATTHVVLDGWGYRGTQSAPLAINGEDSVTAVRAEAYDGAPGTGGNGDGTNEIASMDMKADENQTTGTQGGAIWFSTTNGLLLNQAQVANGFATSTNAGSLDDPDSRLYIGSNGDVGIGTGDIDCGVNTICFLNADVAHDFPTQVYFGSNNGGAANKGGPADLSYSTQVVMVPGTNQGSIPVLTIGGTSATSTFSASGNVGIGTSTPYGRLTVWGTNTASSTLAFNVVNSASSTVFAVFDGGNAQLSGTLTQSSDQRLKTNITSLDASSSLDLINQLNPVSFNWINPDQGSATQLGFIAQQVQQVFPNLVSTTSPTALTPDGTLGLNYIGLISPIIEAIKALSDEVNDLIAEVGGFQESFTSQKITTNELTTNDLCVIKSDGTPVCVTGDQLAALLAGQGSNSSGSISSSTSTTTPPSITINGDNPATIDVGDAYSDLGATAKDSTGNSLGVETFLNGVFESPISLDTSAPATDTIEYVATDSFGDTSTSTRIVFIELVATSTAQ